MCDLEDGLIKTDLPSQTIDKIVRTSFGGIKSSPFATGYFVLLDAPLSPEQAAYIRSASQKYAPTHESVLGRLADRLAKLTHFIEIVDSVGLITGRINYKPVALVLETYSGLQVEGDMRVIQFSGKIYTGFYDPSAFCQAGQLNNIGRPVQTDLQTKALYNIAAQLRSSVREAEAAS